VWNDPTAQIARGWQIARDLWGNTSTTPAATLATYNSVNRESGVPWGVYGALALGAMLLTAWLVMRWRAERKAVQERAREETDMHGSSWRSR
jgi:hypothetical protein